MSTTSWSDRLKIASRGLTAHQMSRIVNWHTPGINWHGCSKGHIARAVGEAIEGHADALWRGSAREPDMMENRLREAPRASTEMFNNWFWNSLQKRS